MGVFKRAMGQGPGRAMRVGLLVTGLFVLRPAIATSEPAATDDPRIAQIEAYLEAVQKIKGLNGSVSLKVARANNILISRFADGVLELVEELSRRLSASGLKH